MELPEKVTTTLESLRKKTKFSVQVVLHRGRYYVYEYKVKTIDGRPKRFSFYLGSIENDGTFVEARHRFLHTRTKNLEQYLKEKERNEKPGIVDDLLYPDDFSIRVLKELSMDSRIPIPEIARRLSTDPARVRHRIEKLKWAYKIKYTIEMKPDTFGYSRYLIMARFAREKPDNERLAKLLDQNPRVQLAAVGEGYYNLIIYVLAEDNNTLENMLYELRSNSVFAKCPGIWYVSYLIEPYGWYIPFRDKFFELLKENIWHRSRDSQRRQKGQFLMSEYAVMKELNADASTSFTDIEKKYNLKEGNANYTYYKLLQSQKIKRPTITIGEIPNMKLEFIYLVQKDINKFNESRIDYLNTIIEETGYPSNKFLYVADTSSPNGIALVEPIFKDYEIEKRKKELESIKGMKERTAFITRVLVGSFGIRRFKMEETGNYKLMMKLIEKRYEKK